MSEVTNKIISIDYKLFRNNAEGEMIETTEGKEPLVFMSGVSQMIPEFEAQVVDLNVGETFSFGIKSENAYGTRSEDAIIELPQDMFKQDGKMIDEIAVDNIVPLQDQNGQVVPAKVVSINEETVTMDVNHPLADQDLHFSGSVIEVREATAEEMEQTEAHVHTEACNH
jgi:FKBP-type peptidyl-prolyl cis-trans isomerase SlyD